MKIALAQINPVVGDLYYNAQKIKKNIQELRNQDVDLIIFPEFSITGYPPKDLMLKDDFLITVEKVLHEEIVPESKTVGILLGLPLRKKKKLYNAAVLICNGYIPYIRYKTLLPDYDVFDEKRYFNSAVERECVEFKGVKIGITVCEDIWNDKDYWICRNYDIDPVEELVNKGAEIIVNISASPYNYGKQFTRLEMLASTARKYNIPVVYVNQVGGNDDLVFDGSSCILGSDGSICRHLKNFQEDALVFDIDDLPYCKRLVDNMYEDISWIYEALVLGVRDYFYKTGFKKALVGLSGGIDSSVTAALAAAALGKENVTGVAMPSLYSSTESLNDAKDLVQNLSIEYRVIPLGRMFSTYIEELKTGKEIDLAEENIQARIRGDILMFISNREGYLVLVTGNKSEMAVGYSTLYGDMCGSLGVLADVPKGKVYQLAHYINRNGIIISENIISKPPSAELKPGQVDEDTLPPYHVLDDILKSYIEDNKSIQEIVQVGYDGNVVESVIRKVDRAEYKRQQAPPGIKVTSKAFGWGRRIPIVQRWNR
ncbi:MAG: NAD+ synthase [Clostridiales bacterium]|nr:NAD+ synthase [Clostridiales bacterium]MCF8023690.1 NAD+ synthase [Clostridiales bacterium]